jgi:hypothetical protein
MWSLSRLGNSLTNIYVYVGDIGGYVYLDKLWLVSDICQILISLVGL